MDFVRKSSNHAKRPREGSERRLLDQTFGRIRRSKYSRSADETESPPTKQINYPRHNYFGDDIRVIKGIEKELPNEWRRLMRQAPRADIHWFRSNTDTGSLMFVFDNEDVAKKTWLLGNVIKEILPDHTPSSISLPDSSSHLTDHYIRMDGVDILLENLIDDSIDLFELVYLFIQALRIAYVLTCKGYLMCSTPIFGVAGMRPNIQLLLLNFYALEGVSIKNKWDETFQMALKLNLLSVTNTRIWKFFKKDNPDKELKLNRRLEAFVNSLYQENIGPELITDFMSDMKNDLFIVHEDLIDEQPKLLEEACNNVLSRVPKQARFYAKLSSDKIPIF